MRPESAFDGQRRHRPALVADEVSPTVDEMVLAVFVFGAEVARVVPAAAVRGGGRLGIVEVARPMTSLWPYPCWMMSIPKRALNGSKMASGMGTAPRQRTGLDASSGRGSACHRNRCIAPSVNACVAPK
jgi:hypothetical protein